jgi:2-dehydropantoate 2-reductase
VIGSGVIGSLLAAHLARVCEVTCLVRRPEHAEALERDGLRVSGKSDFTARLRASTDARAVVPFDVGIVATKALHVDASMAPLAGLAPDAAIVTVQNGIGSEQVVQRHGAWPIVSGVTFMSGTRHGDTHVEYELDTPTWLGPFAGTATPQALVDELAALIIAAGLKAEALPDLLPAQWSKLIFNSAVNAVAATTGLPHVRRYAQIEELDDLGHVVRGMMDEGKAVAAAAGIELHDDPWEMNVRAVSRGSTGGVEYAHPPSMLEDVRAHRATEVDFITGALVREAERLGVPAPLNATLYRLVRGVEASWAYGGTH